MRAAVQSGDLAASAQTRGIVGLLLVGVGGVIVATLMMQMRPFFDAAKESKRLREKANSTQGEEAKNAKAEFEAADKRASEIYEQLRWALNAQAIGGLVTLVGVFIGGGGFDRGLKARRASRRQGLPTPRQAVVGIVLGLICLMPLILAVVGIIIRLSSGR